MKYKVGDKVRIKSIDWYNHNKDEEGYIYFNHNSFVSDMSEFCGKIATITKKCEKYYFIDIDKRAWSWTDDMLEDLSGSKRVKITLPKDCKVSGVNATVEDGCIVVEYVPKKEKKFVPEDGDIVFAKILGYDWIFIFRKEDTGRMLSHCSLCLLDDDFFMDEYTDKYFMDENDIEYMRLATKEEQKKLFDVMKSKGFKWNAIDKKVERLRWRAENNKCYYCIITDNGHIEVIHTTDDRLHIDNQCYDSGNYFKTESEANEYAEKIKKLLKER